MASGETKTCPVCDSIIDAHARRCSECNTDLSLFDVDADGVQDVDRVPSANGKSIDDILASIMTGKDVGSQVFEDIKTIASNNHAAEENDILGDAEAAGPVVEFECPNCGTRVSESAKVCPGCGAQFAEETVEQFECPLCSAVVDMEAASCPNCGVKFAEETPEAPPAPAAPPVAAKPSGPAAQAAVVEQVPAEARRIPAKPAAPTLPSPMERLWALREARKAPPREERMERGELYKALPRLVNEVKPLLLTAKRVNVDIAGEKELISQAIAFGKKREVEKAVGLIRTARHRLEASFTEQIAKRIEAVLVEAERSRATGTDVGAVLDLCGTATDALDARDYATASDKVGAAREEFEARSGGYAKAHQELDAVRTLFADARDLGVTAREGESFLSRGEAAMQARNWDQAAGFAVQARQSLIKVLPDALDREMKRARSSLLEMKVRGGDLTKPVGILKQWSIHMKRGEYADAVRYVRMFREEVGNG